MTRQPNICCIIVAAGSGRRFGAALPKQFCDLNGRPVLMTTIDRVRAALPSADLRLVISSDYASFWMDLCQHHSFTSPAIIFGGDTRWQSVKNAVDTIDCAETDMIFVHDGARPLLSPAVVDRLVGALQIGANGAVPCVPLADSIRKISPDGSSVAVDRSLYRAVQTPQAFPAALLKDCYQRPFSPLMTDDASVVEFAGYHDIAIVEGTPETIKITTPADMAVVSELTRSQS